jgi:hypothetical protein
MTKHLLLILLLTASILNAADDRNLEALKAADDERITATLTADSTRLLNVLSHELRYAHSTGAVDSQASLIESLTSGRIRYESFRYEDRAFEILSQGIALMTGRAHVKVRTPEGPIENHLSFLAVWREESGKWRFRAWQSCKMPTPPVASPAPPTPK